MGLFKYPPFHIRTSQPPSPAGIPNPHSSLMCWPKVLVGSADTFGSPRECCSWEEPFSPVLKDGSAHEREKLMML